MCDDQQSNRLGSCPFKKGTWEQLEFMRMRLEREEPLWNEADNPEVEHSLEVRALATLMMKIAKKFFATERQIAEQNERDKRRKTRRKKKLTVHRRKKQ